MKRILLILAIFGVCTALSAPDEVTSPAGDPPAAPAFISRADSQVSGSGPATFLNVAWGDGPGVAKSEMAKRDGVTLLRENGDELVYGGGKCAGLAVDSWRFRFANGNFYQGIVSFEFPVVFNNKGSVSDALMDAIKGLLDQKYGSNRSNDSSGEHHLETWSFPETADSRGEKLIQLNYNWQAGVMSLTYTNLYYQSLGNPFKVTPGDL